MMHLNKHKKIIRAMLKAFSLRLAALLKYTLKSSPLRKKLKGFSMEYAKQFERNCFHLFSKLLLLLR